MEYPFVHTFVARHFVTAKEEVIYDRACKDGPHYIKAIKSCVKKNNIDRIEIKVSDSPRTLLTASILHSMLLESCPGIQIIRPEIDNILTRDPRRQNCDSIGEYFKTINKLVDKEVVGKHKIILYVTHSSCYKSIYRGLFQGIYNDFDKINDVMKGEMIIRNALSYIKNYSKKGMYYNKNIVKND